MSATLQQRALVPAGTDASLRHRIVEKFTNSRYLALSVTIHILIVALLGSYAFYRTYIEPQHFIAESGFESAVPVDIQDLPERPIETLSPEKLSIPTPIIGSPDTSPIVLTALNSPYKTPAGAYNSMPILPPSPDLPNVGGKVGTMPIGLPSSMGSRGGQLRIEAMKKNGMKAVSELAVLRGLEWLRLNQNKDGSWGDTNKSAMTGLALLCFLGHGETPDSQQYGVTVNKAVQWIIDTGTANQGHLCNAKAFSQQGVYEHGMCTYALGEYYTMTKDERVIELFKQAIGYIVQGQGPGGGWMYSFDKTANDLSVSGWQIQALKAAHLSQLNLPGVDASLDKAMSYIESVKGPKGGYGYRTAGDKYSLSGVGILCRLFWKGERNELRKGMEWILEDTEKTKPVKYKSPDADLYAWYYHTQACLMFGSAAWQKWNGWFQDELVQNQSNDGSWPIPGGKAHGPSSQNSMTGAVYRTTLCVLMLEVFYRYMPANQN